MVQINKQTFVFSMPIVSSYSRYGHTSACCC